MSAGLSEDFDPALLARVEDAGLNACAPREQRWLDGWLLRLSPAKAKRGRSINALADGHLPLDTRLALAREAFAAAGLPMIVRITPFTRPATLAADLQDRGFRRFDDTRVMVRPALETLPAPAALPHGCEMRRADPGAFADLLGAWRGSSKGQRAAHAQRLAHSPVSCEPWVLYRGTEPVAAGQATQEADLVGLYDVFTPPAHRAQGWAGRLCAALLARARQSGATTAYLQVDAENTPARTLYHRLGFRDAYAYHYLTDDPEAH